MKIFYALLVLILPTTIHAQELKAFKVGVGVGYVAPLAGEGGALLYLEPAYRITSKVQIGLRIESAMISKGLETINTTVTGETVANTSYTINGQFYFNKNYIMPFIGLGAGLYNLAAIEHKLSEGPDRNTEFAKNVFGIYPRLGVDVGHFQLTADFNIVPSADLTGNGSTKNSYISVRVGISVGGGTGKKTEPRKHV